MRTVVLYGREGCCLCNEAREMLVRAQARYPFVLQERDIESDERLHRAYLERIPVITIDGEEAFELLIDEDELDRRIARVTTG
jgi:glutaredoxin